MERFWRLVLISCLAIFGSACSKDDENTGSDVERPAAIYYVKYAASHPFYYLESVCVTTEKGPQNFTVRNNSWTQTFGPVSKGFRASISVSGRSGYTLQIYDSKDNGPFVYKGSSSYVIDF